MIQVYEYEFKKVCIHVCVSENAQICICFYNNCVNNNSSNTNFYMLAKIYILSDHSTNLTVIFYFCSNAKFEHTCNFTISDITSLFYDIID
jgi:hypothetical protein